MNPGRRTSNFTEEPHVQKTHCVKTEDLAPRRPHLPDPHTHRGCVLKPLRHLRMHKRRPLGGLESSLCWWVGGWRAFSVPWENLPEKLSSFLAGGGGI